MTRAEHNAHYGVARQRNEQVCSATFGYGELSQYDARCSCCWVGCPHDWDRHDASILRSRETEKP